MSEMMLSFLIAVAILAAMFVFIPMLEFCGPHCQRIFGRSRTRQPQEQEQPLREAA